jgi:hypothetical protein
MRVNNIVSGKRKEIPIRDCIERLVAAAEEGEKAQQKISKQSVGCEEAPA